MPHKRTYIKNYSHIQSSNSLETQKPTQIFIITNWHRKYIERHMEPTQALKYAKRQSIKHTNTHANTYTNKHKYRNWTQTHKKHSQLQEYT